MLFIYRMVKLNMFFGSLLCTVDHIELSEIVEYSMTSQVTRNAHTSNIASSGTASIT